MKNFKNTLLSLAVVAGGLLTTACGDAFTTASEPVQDLKPKLGAFFSKEPAPGMTVMRRTTPLASDVSVTGQFNYYDEGWLSLPAAGIHIYVPQGAVRTKERVAITLTGLAGDAVAFEFAPHGIVFAKQLRIRVDVAKTEAEYLIAKDPPNGMLSDMIGVYYEWNADGQAVPVEKFPIYWNDMGADKGPGSSSGVIEFYTNHFSGYAIAM